MGLDGSDGGRAALSWALAEARLRGAQLDVVSAWEYPFEWAEGFNPQWLQDEEFFRASALERAQADVDELLDGKPQPSWLRIFAVKGAPADVLVAGQAAPTCSWWVRGAEVGSPACCSAR